MVVIILLSYYIQRVSSLRSLTHSTPTCNTELINDQHAI